ncbi:outer membrane protein assembly factor BamD [bacterium BMS3Abin04]|nr:outer membrane protein assembly factor BamD [bacterium BMS3Abin04]
MKLVYLIVFLISIGHMQAQHVDIVPYLKAIESGNIQKAKTGLRMLKTSSSDNPDVIFLDAVLTEDGSAALKKYSKVYTDYPKSKFADAALYRIFSYYFALGLYKKAETNLTKLKTEYPESHYIKTADRHLPDEINSTTIPIVKTNHAKKKDKHTELYTVQAGAFINMDNANRLANSFSKSGLDASISSKDVGGTTLNIVTVGKFSDRSDAEELLKVLKKNYRLNGRIKKVK